MIVVCDTFIKFNYPGLPLDDGYRRFLDDMETHYDKTDKEIWQTNDSTEVMKANRTLKEAFGDGYNEVMAEFLPFSTRTSCLEKTSNNRFVDDIIQRSMSVGGGVGPHIVAGQLMASDIDPTIGQVKTIYLTEVVFRILFFLTTR